MKFKIVLSKFLVTLFAMTIVLAVPANVALADSFKNVTLGGDLNPQQKEQMLKYFGVTKNDANVIEVNIDEETKYLSGAASKSQIGSKSISCSYVEPTSKGGLTVSINNITWVNESMIKNALITAGIENANVKVSAPFKVSGTAALTGILKGFESSKGGKKIDENKKKAANEELVVTGNLGEKIGQDEAAGLVNEVKKEVIKEKPKNEEELKKVVTNVTNNYNFNLSNEDLQSLTALMSKINGLNLDFSKLKNQLNGVTDKLQTALESEEAKGFFSKIWTSIKNFFSDIFASDNSSEKSTASDNTDKKNATNENKGVENATSENKSKETTSTENNKEQNTASENKSVENQSSKSKDKQNTVNDSNSEQNTSTNVESVE